MAVPLPAKKVVKKRVKKFKRPQSDCKVSVKLNWRRPKSIDSRVSRTFKGCRLMPNIGYNSDKKTKHHLPNAFKNFFVDDVQQVKTYCTESTRKGKEIVGSAAQLNVVTNRLARLRSQEDQ